MDITWITNTTFLVDHTIVAVCDDRDARTTACVNADEVPTDERAAVIYTVDGNCWFSTVDADTLAAYLSPDAPPPDTAPRR